MPPTGQEVVVINTSERALSVDINRLQSFKERDLAEAFRYFMNVSGGFDDTQAGGLDNETVTTTTPLSSEVMNGLLVQPQGGSLVLLISAGLAYCVNPDSPPNSDNSVYQYVKDPGIQTLGELVMTANPSGSTRIDIIECQPISVVEETDSRDIFNTVTGLFNATTVTKAIEANMTYRVRAGTPGAGIPALAAGWLPLAVASVPTLATSNDNISFWDVRPLIGDRIFQPSHLQLNWPRNTYARFQGVCNPITGAANYIMQGIVEGNRGSYRIGGQITGSLLADTNSCDLLNAANIAAGFTPTVGTPCFAYLVTPFGLPRWAMYTQGPTGRVPRSPRGIIVLSGIAPNVDGTPSSAVPLPTACGLGSSSSNALCFWMSTAVIIGGQTTFRPTIALGKSVCSEKVAALSAPTSSTITSTKWLLQSGTHFPANAKRLLIAVGINVNSDGSNPCVIELPAQFNIYPVGDTSNILYAEIGTLQSSSGGSGSNIVPATQTQTIILNTWIQVPSVYPSSASLSFQFEWAYTVGNLGVGSPTVSSPNGGIIGYEL